MLNPLGWKVLLWPAEKTLTQTCWTATCRRTALVEGCGITMSRPRACLLSRRLLSMMQSCWRNFNRHRNAGLMQRVIVIHANTLSLIESCSVDFYYSGPQAPELITPRSHIYPAPRYLKLCYLAHRKAGEPFTLNSNFLPTVDRHSAKLLGNNAADGSTDNHRRVSASKLQELKNSVTIFHDRWHSINVVCRYLSQNHNLMNYINDPREVKEYLLQ